VAIPEPDAVFVDVDSSVAWSAWSDLLRVQVGGTTWSETTHARGDTAAPTGLGVQRGECSVELDARRAVAACRPLGRPK